MSQETKHLFKFGPFHLDAQKRTLYRENEVVPLTPKAFETLVVLLENSGRVVSKEELMKSVWPDSFVEESNLSQNIFTLRKALGDSTQERRYIITIPGRGYQFTEKVLSMPVAASDSMAPAPQGMGNVETTEELVLQSRTRSRLVIEEETTSRVWLWAVVAIVAVAAIGGTWYYGHNSRSEPSTASLGPALKRRPSVAIMGFRNLSRSAEAAWLSTALSEMLDTELAAGEKLRTIPGEQVSRAKLELSLADPEALAKDSLGRLHSNLGADYVVLGSYTVLGNKGDDPIRLDIRLQDARAGETIAEEAVTGTESNLFDLISQAGTRLRQRLEAGSVGGEQAGQVRASLPTNLEAARLYSEGLAKLRVFEALAARDLLQRAVAAEPNFALGHAALATSLWQLGYESKAQDEGKRALDLSSNLSREERLAIEAQYRERTKDWPKAIEIYRALIQFYPDKLDYSLQLANVQAVSGTPQEAVNTLEAARKLPDEIGADPRIDLAEAFACSKIGDFKRAYQFAVAAREKGRIRNAPLIVAQAKVAEGSASGWLGDSAGAIAAFTESGQAFEHAGDVQNAATSLVYMGNAYYDQGNFSASLEKLNEALSIYRKLGSRRNESNALNNIGNVLYDQGSLEEAKKYYEQTLAIDQERAYKPALGNDYGNIANVLDGMGLLAESLKMQELALKLFDEGGNKRGVASTIGNIGNLLDETGDLAGAIQRFEQAHKMHVESGYKRGTGFILSAWAMVLMEQDDLPGARAKLESAWAIRKELADQANLAVNSFEMAQLLIEENRASEAEKSARDAADNSAKAKSTENETIARATLARALLAQRKVSEAQKAAAQAIALSDKTSYRYVKFEARIADALVRAATGKAPEAKKILNSVIAEANKDGFVGYSLTARLELARLELQTGQVGAAEADFAAIHKDASSKGYYLIARKANTRG